MYKKTITKAKRQRLRDRNPVARMRHQSWTKLAELWNNRNSLVFKKAVLRPLKTAGVKVPTKKSDIERQMNKWMRFILSPSLLMHETNFALLPSKTKMQQMQKQMGKLQIELEKQTLLSHSHLDLILELGLGMSKLENFINAKGAKRQSDYKYSPGVVLVTKSLIEYWQKKVNSRKKISGFSFKEHVDEPGTKPGKEIDVKHNPAGHFIQQVLKEYFKKDYNNIQIRTLLKKVSTTKFPSPNRLTTNK